MLSGEVSSPFARGAGHPFDPSVRHYSLRSHGLLTLEARPSKGGPSSKVPAARMADALPGLRLLTVCLHFTVSAAYNPCPLSLAACSPRPVRLFPWSCGFRPRPCRYSARSRVILSIIRSAMFSRSRRSIVLCALSAREEDRSFPLRGGIAVPLKRPFEPTSYGECVTWRRGAPEGSLCRYSNSVRLPTQLTSSGAFEDFSASTA